MTERIKQGFEGISLSMRFVLPILGCAYFYAYQGDMHSIKDSIAQIKSSQSISDAENKSGQQQIWKTLSDLKDDTNNKFIAIYQRLN